MSLSHKLQQTQYSWVIVECYWAFFYMQFSKCLHNFLTVLVHMSNKMWTQKESLASIWTAPIVLCGNVCPLLLDSSNLPTVAIKRCGNALAMVTERCTTIQETIGRAAKGFLPSPPCGSFSLRAWKTQSLVTLKMERYVPPKRWFFLLEPHCVISQKAPFFTGHAVLYAVRIICFARN
jgi:hypothetical protein